MEAKPHSVDLSVYFRSCLYRNMRPRSPRHLKRSRTSSALGIVPRVQRVLFTRGKIGRTRTYSVRWLGIGGLWRMVVGEFFFVKILKYLIKWKIGELCDNFYSFFHVTREIVENEKFLKRSIRVWRIVTTCVPFNHDEMESLIGR